MQYMTKTELTNGSIISLFFQEIADPQIIFDRQGHLHLCFFIKNAVVLNARYVSHCVCPAVMFSIAV